MAKVLYHNANLVGDVLEVLKENADGTLDIGTGKTVLVKSCQLAAEPKAGYALLCLAPKLEEPKAPEVKGEGKKDEKK
jgi:hypothetical protein